MPKQVATKAILINDVAQALNCSRAEAEPYVNALFDVLRDHLSAGVEVHISAIGRFRIVERKERKARNPRTGEPVLIPARAVLRFKPSAALQAAVA